LAAASDVPNKYDVVINGEGYLLANAEQQRAAFGLSPIFIPRQNTRGSFGDEDQDFFWTWTQKDWSNGEGLKYARSDEDSVSRYWAGSKLTKRAGQLNIAYDTNTIALGFTPSINGWGSYRGKVCAADATNLYEITGTTATSKGAHGAGSNPCMASDGTFLYIAGATKIRKWNNTTFVDFSATTAQTGLAYLNNALYSVNNGNGTFTRYDTAGAATTIYTWKAADGTSAAAPQPAFMVPYGGKMLFGVVDESIISNFYSLWIYDGTAPAKVAQLPRGFTLQDIVVIEGAAFLCGVSQTPSGVHSVIYVYVNGALVKAWQSRTAGGSNCYGAESLGKLVFLDGLNSQLLMYDPDTGGVTPLATTTYSGKVVASTNSEFIHWNDSTSVILYPASSVAASASATTSLIDFDSSLTKVLRGVTVEWEDDVTDTGATVDIAYRVGDLDGSYTTLQTGAVSGTEYTLTNITGKSISVKVTLNKSGSTYGPALKRIKVRAVPVQPGFKKRTYRLALHGKDGEGNLSTRSGRGHRKDGLEMLQDLETAASSTNPIAVTDWSGTIAAAVIESLNVIATGDQEFMAEVLVRGV
jgi:hypothetical protein